MEENSAYLAFLDIWHQAMWYLFLGAAALTVILVLSYWIRYASAGSLKAKFDLASRSETKTYLNANYVIAAGIVFIVNTTYQDVISLSPMWVFIRVFIGLCFGTLHGYIAYLIFKYYYPGPLDKKLKRLRYTPRINPSNGNTMKLLSEDEEDAYLDEGMQAEEDAFSVDYDVWIDEATGETKIEKYKGHLNALECDRCGFQTLKLQREEILRQPTNTQDGEILKEYKCSYCGRIKRKTQNLSTNVDKERDLSTGKLIADPLSHDNRLDLIKIEIQGTNGEKKLFEFQNLKQAQNFLKEFDFDKLKEEM
ncbi:hypothetical protein [Marinoscillum sp.]|uniref:hypothetical protein n=1 Tax=Marinoscillum sp. TaxID=2024838 RepID=UPI003BAC1A12